MRRRRGRRSLLRAALVVVLAACGDGAGEGSSVSGSSAVTTGSTVGAGDGSAAPGGSTTAPLTGSTPPGAPSTTDAGADPAVPPGSLSVGGVGDFAPALLQAGAADRLVLEVHADVEPRSGTAEHLAALLRDVSGKPVAIVSAGAPGGGDRAWTAADLTAAADAGAATAQGGGVAALRILFVRGTYEGRRGVLGVAVRGDVAAVFVDRVEAAGGLLGAGTGIEVAVAAHELGHLLGLVDLQLATGRADPEHPGHSRNEASVMYWAVESDLVGQLLGANPPRDFDADDRADLAAIRAGG